MLTFEVVVDAVVEECTRPKVDKSDVARLGIDKDVLVFYVSMDDAGVVQRQCSLHDLSEETASFVLLETTALGDMIKQVPPAPRPLHHDYEAVRLFKVVDQADHTGYIGGTLEQTDLDRQPASAFLANITMPCDEKRTQKHNATTTCIFNSTTISQ